MEKEEIEDELPEEFQNIPEEFRMLQTKFDNNRIFTNISNEIRVESLLKAKQFKDGRKTNMSRDAKPKYMSKIDNNIDMFREIEKIIDLETKDAMLAQKMKQSLIGAEPQILKASQSANAIRPRRKKVDKLPSIKKRYGNSVVSSWCKGPIDLPKDRYFDLHDRSIYNGSKDPRGRQLRQQTKVLLNSLQTSNKKAVLHDTCRRRKIDEFKVKGEDHVVGVYDELIAAQQELDRTTKVSLDDEIFLRELSDNVKFRKRKMKRKSHSRILELWDCLGCPSSSKLSFKLQAEQPVPDDLSPKNKSKTPITIISKLENTADCVHALNMLVLALQLWRERKYPDIYTSSGLSQPLIDICRAAGVEKCVKISNEKMPAWLARLCKQLWASLKPQLRFWVSFSDTHLDKHFTTFIHDLSEEIYGFLSVMEEDKMVRDASVRVERVDRETHVVEGKHDLISTDLQEKITEVLEKNVRTEVMRDDTNDDVEESHVMRDSSVKYNTAHLPRKTQKIYESLPPIVASVDINKVNKNLLKEPNKIISKRLAKMQD